MRIFSLNRAIVSIMEDVYSRMNYTPFDNYLLNNYNKFGIHKKDSFVSKINKNSVNFKPRNTLCRRLIPKMKIK